MTLKNSKHVLVVSYNSVRSLSSEAEHLLRTHAHVYDNAFAKPKSRAVVTLTNSGLVDAYALRRVVTRIIVFLGKMDSGSGEIADFFAKDFADVREKLFFVLCPHELAEKEALLRKLGFHETQWTVFADGEYREGRQCNEWPTILGEVLRAISE